MFSVAALLLCSLTGGDDMEYTTVQGDTFDLIAYKCYGDPDLIAPIIRANSKHTETAVFDFGEVLTIPDIEKTDESIYLPPWRK